MNRLKLIMNKLTELMKQLMKQLINRISGFKLLSRKNQSMVLASAAVVLVGVIVLIAIGVANTDTVYRELAVQYGNLTVGITETGNVSVEETEQTFDVDISEYSASDTSYSWTSGGTDPFQAMSQIMSGISASSSDSDGTTTRALTVDEVFVSAGEEVKAGDPICSLLAESVENIRNALAEDEAEAQNTWNEKQTDAKVSELSASQELETNQTLEENKTDLAEKQAELATQKKVLENATFKQRRIRSSP